MKKEINIIQNNTIETQWLEIKNKFKCSEEDYNLAELDHLTSDLIAQLALLTTKGYTEIGGVSIDTYKNRVWNVIENIGLLPEYKDIEDINDDLEIVDEWDKYDEEENFEIDDSLFYKK